MYLVVVVRLKYPTVETVGQSVALHPLTSILSSLCSKFCYLHNISKINLNPLIFVVGLCKPAVTVAVSIFVTYSRLGGPPRFAVLRRRRDG